MQRLRIHLHGKAVARRPADADWFDAAAVTFPPLLLGWVLDQRPLLEVPADCVRGGAVKARAVLEDGEGEVLQDIAATRVVELVLKLEAQAPQELGPFGVACVGRAVDDEASGTVTVVLQLPLDQVGDVVLARHVLVTLRRVRDAAPDAFEPRLGLLELDILGRVLGRILRRVHRKLACDDRVVSC